MEGTLDLRRARSAYDAGAATLPPAHQLVMLLDGAIRRLRQAKVAIAQGRVEERHAAVRKAHAILDALHNCLDHQRGGAVATSLDRLYRHLLFRMTRIDIENDAAICEEVAARLEPLRDAWAAVAAKLQAPPVKPAPPPRPGGAAAGAALSA
jgi:flagellar protein FliS